MFKKIKELLKIYSSEDTTQFNDNLIEARKRHYNPQNIFKRMLVLNMVDGVGSSLLNYFDSGRLGELSHDENNNEVGTIVMTVDKTIVIDGSAFEATFKAEFKWHEHMPLAIYTTMQSGTSLNIHFLGLRMASLRHVQTDTVLLTDYTLISSRNSGKGEKFAYNPAYFSFLLESWASIYNSLSKRQRVQGITEFIPDEPSLDLKNVTLAMGNLIAMLNNTEYMTFDHNNIVFQYNHVIDNSYESLRNIDSTLFQDQDFVDHAKSSFDPVMVDKVINYHKLVGKL